MSSVGNSTPLLNSIMKLHLLREYKKGIEQFTNELLAEYVRNLKPRSGFQGKEINDPIWQTISLAPFEVVFLDSPLIQRLRRIRQLGVAHWVYPGAMHTRFEHSLGCVHQVNCLLASFNARGHSGKSIVEEEWVNFLRLAALCHDIGHGLMSHVSENAFADQDEIVDVTDAFADEQELELAKLSEMAAVYMFGSSEFKKLVAIAKQLHPTHKLPDDVIGSLKKVVVGRPIHDRIPLLHELISGPFDADKLDYMLRDAKMAGIPNVTDVSRIVQKVRAVELSKSNLPVDIGRTVEGNHPSYFMTGIALSGGRSLDELMLGRTLLFDKIYRHQKVRSAEHMVTVLLKNLSYASKISPMILPYLFYDDDLLNLNKLLWGDVTKSDDKIRKVALDIALDLSARLRERKLLVRAFAFAQYMPVDSYWHDQQQKTGLERFLRDTARISPTRESLSREIAIETQNILKLLNKEQLSQKLPGKTLIPYVTISPPESPASGNDIMRAYLIAADNRVVKFKDDSAETRGWADAYLLTNDIGYVFTLAELAPYVYLASEKLLRLQYKIRIPSSMLSYAKQDSTAIDSLRNKLNAKGFYNKCPSDLKPIPKRLLKADVDQLLDSVLDKASGYEGVVSEKLAVHGAHLSRQRILDWCRQFEDDEAIDGALRALCKIKLIGRSETLMALEKLIRSDAELQSACLCALGEAKDSGQIVTYYSGDIKDKFRFEITDLERAIGGDKHIILIDDFLGSGQQVVTMIESMLGLPLSYKLGESRRLKLTNRQIELFKSKQLAFVFSAGLDEGVNRLKKFIKKQKLNATVNIGLPEKELPTIFQLADKKSSFCRYCKSIGKDLLFDPSGDHDTAWIKKRTLGYGNRGLLIIFPYNTPAHTLTCLWAFGKYGGKDWTPLFPRRKKE